MEDVWSALWHPGERWPVVPERVCVDSLIDPTPNGVTVILLCSENGDADQYL